MSSSSSSSSHHLLLLLMTRARSAGVLWDGALFLEFLLQRSLESARLARGTSQNCPCHCLFLFFFLATRQKLSLLPFLCLFNFFVVEIVLGTVSVPPSPFPLPPPILLPTTFAPALLARVFAVFFSVHLSLICTPCVCICVQGLGFWV